MAAENARFAVSDVSQDEIDTEEDRAPAKGKELALFRECVRVAAHYPDNRSLAIEKTTKRAVSLSITTKPPPSPPAEVAVDSKGGRDAPDVGPKMQYLSLSNEERNQYTTTSITSNLALYEVGQREREAHSLTHTCN